MYHDFRYHPKQFISGDFDEWMFDHQGIFAWTVEIWSPQRQAGIEEYKFIDWYREHPIEDDLKMLKWSDETLRGAGYIDWYDFDHPELGVVQLGGWNQLYAFRNPPPQFLEKEIAPFADWLVWHLLISPRLEIHEASSTALGEGVYRVRLVVQNSGWLPSYVTKNALEKKVSRPIVAEIDIPEDASLTGGKQRQEIGHLEGRAYKPVSPSGFGAADPTSDRAKIEWVVCSPNGGTVRVSARHARAGTVSAEVPLVG